jgi:hypothetical protein
MPGIVIDGSDGILGKGGKFKLGTGKLGISSVGSVGMLGKSNGNFKLGSAGGNGMPGIVIDGSDGILGNGGKFKLGTGKLGISSVGSSGIVGSSKGSLRLGSDGGKGIEIASGSAYFDLKLYKVLSPNLATTVTTIYDIISPCQITSNFYKL